MNVAAGLEADTRRKRAATSKISIRLIVKANVFIRRAAKTHLSRKCGITTLMTKPYFNLLAGALDSEGLEKAPRRV
jgi:hypothetical protein